MKSLIGLLVLLLSGAASGALHPDYSEDLIHLAVTKRLAESPTWLRLVHYKKNFWGKWVSQADGERFFLSAHGKTDPEAELFATLKAFFLEKGFGKDQEPAQCQFPARYAWLKTELNFDDARLTPTLCPRFLDFKESVAAKSVSLIFSSYYLNNPSSAFGHSLLRLNKTALGFDGKSFELLDSGVNYAAVVNEDNPLLYAFKGLFGLFQGTFTRLPYYYKVREYNDYESRDLWSYDLNLSQAQVDRIVEHLWELGSTYFDYWYLDENCSYHMMSVLETALPDVALTDKLPAIVVPSETVKVLTQVQGLVARVRYRPSIRAQFEKRIAALSPEQSTALKRLAFLSPVGELPTDLSDVQKAEVLDAAIDYMDLKHFRELVEHPEGDEAKWKKRLLATRARLPVISPELKMEVPEKEIPHSGHGTGRVGLEGGAQFGGDAYSGISYRFALHDLVDPDRGYPDTAQIEFFGAKLRYFPHSGRVWIEDLKIFSVTSLSPVTSFSQQLSWRARLGAATVRDRSCDHCVAGGIELGTGFAKNLVRQVTAFLTADAELFGSPQLDGGFFRPGVGPTLGVRIAVSDELVGLVTGQYRYRFFTAYQEVLSAHGELRWTFLKDWALNIKTAGNPDGWESSLGIFYYF